MKLIALSVIIMLALTGCNRPVTRAMATESGDGRLTVVATIFAPYDFAREIAGELADIHMLIQPAQDIHSYEPSPQDIIRIMNADILIHAGGAADAWLGRVLADMDTPGPRMVTMLDIIGHHNHHDCDDDHGHDDGHDDGHDLDTHVWTSPRNAMLIAELILEALCAAGPANADAFTQNAANYIRQLEELDTAFREVVQSASGNTLIFGDRFPFRHFVNAYGLDYYAAFPGCSSETEPSAATVAFLINKIRDENIPVVFHAELSNARMANTIAEATGVRVLQLHAAHNISRDDFLAGVSYLDLMRRNAEALRVALS